MMTRPGPAPKPSALRLVEGTDRKGRSGRALDVSREPLAPPELPQPPYDLAPEVLTEWRRTVAHLAAMGTASAADANQIAVYVEAVVMHRTCARMLAQTSLLVKGDKSIVANKLIAIQRDAVPTVLRLAQEFGLTPAARTRVEVAKRESPQSSEANPFSG